MLSQPTKETPWTEAEPGAGAAKNWIAIVRDVSLNIVNDEIPGRAAQMSFYFFLSVFPMLLILMAMLGSFLDAQALMRETLDQRLAWLAPPAITRLFTGLLDDLAARTGAPLTWGIGIALWAASSGMVATIRGLNQAYQVKESRSWWRRRLVGIVLTLVLMSVLGVAMLLLSFGAPLAETVAQRMDLGTAVPLIWRIAQWPVICLFALAAFSMLFHYAPNRLAARWHWWSPGTLVAVTLWLVATLGLKFYVLNIGTYNLTYGSLGGVIVLLLWFYVTAIAILTGAQINARSERDQFV